jgi:hypothetical protein
MPDNWVAFGNIKRTLRPEQRKHLESVLWLLEDQYMSEGRSTVLAVAFIQLALQRPNCWVCVFDHDVTHGSAEAALEYQMGRIQSLLKSEKREDNFEFKKYSFRFIGKLMSSNSKE